jgi:predicted Zn-dependent protease
MRAARLILSIFLSRSTEELYVLRDGKFEMITQGQGMMISSAVNGSQFSFYALSMLSPLEVAQMAQLAIDHKEAGWCRPTTRTTVRFM